MISDFAPENELIKKGYKYICGVDEVGRGPLAGPVTVCAAVIDISKFCDGVTDSKKLSEKRRELLFPEIEKCCLCYKVVFVDAKRIDEINILNATKECMVKAVETLEILPDIVLIDAVKLDLSVESKSIIHGDALSYAIGCASILAKVSRDRYMARCDEQYPEYGFKKNKGYGTKEHIEAIIKYGVTPLHRAQFVQSAVEHYEQKGGRQ